MGAIRRVVPRAFSSWRTNVYNDGAAIRLYTRVRNPNQFGVTLSTLTGDLFLQGSRAAEADFPLGLPLTAGADTVIPLDLRVSFADIPGLADAIRRAVAGQPLGYACRPSCPPPANGPDNRPVARRVRRLRPPESG